MRFIQFRKPDPYNPDLQPSEDDEEVVRVGFLRKLKRVASKIGFADQLLAAYFCAIDSKTPLKVKAILMAALAYFVVPTDLIPDFLIGFGYTDDISVLVAAISSVKANITKEHEEKAQELLDDKINETVS